MAPLRGWAPKGQRLHAKLPYGHWKTMTFIAALRSDRIEAPFVFDQPINGASFTVWVEEQLCPTLSPGDIVILDNLASQKNPLSETRSGPEAGTCFSCRLTAQTSIPSSRSSPS